MRKTWYFSLHPLQPAKLKNFAHAVSREFAKATIAKELQVPIKDVILWSSEPYIPRRGPLHDH